MPKPDRLSTKVDKLTAASRPNAIPYQEKSLPSLRPHRNSAHKIAHKDRNGNQTGPMKQVEFNKMIVMARISIREQKTNQSDENSS